MNVLIGLSLALLHHSDPDFAKAWDGAEGAIRRMYYARDARKEDMNRLLAKYGPEAKRATTKAEFSAVVNHMIDDFKDSHFALLSDEEQGYYNFDSLAKGKNGAEMPHIGAWFRHTGDSYTVQMIINGGAAEKAELRKGDLMLSIDGEPFSPILGFKDKVGKTVKLKLKRGSETLEKSLEVSKGSAAEMFLSGTKDSARIIEEGNRKIGYVHLWTMSSEDQKSAISGLVYGKFSKTDAMILDIRDGFGGRPEGYGDPFFRPEVSLEWKFGNFTNKEMIGYGRPLVLLTNGGSRSAKEVFSYIMKKSGRALVIGSTTAGHVLGTTPYRLNDWAYLEIPIVDLLTDGYRIEGKGVAPDIALSKEFDDAGKDLYVERALQELKKRIK